jgi:ABC-type Na+ efflux pump permease subunit
VFNPKLRAIIKREYFQQVKNKAFWISTILIPVLGLFFIFIQVLLGKSMVSTGKIAVVDLTGRLYDELVLEAKAEEADRRRQVRREGDHRGDEQASSRSRPSSSARSSSS